MINEPRSGQLTVAELIAQLADADPNALVGFAIDSAFLQEVAQTSVGLDAILLALRVRSVVGPAITLEPVPSMQARAVRPDAVGLCLVCGLDCVAAGFGEPWGETGCDPTFDFCPCCGTEFGYQDVTLDAARKNRQRWLDAGGSWSDPRRQPPADWTAVSQMKALPERAW